MNIIIVCISYYSPQAYKVIMLHWETVQYNPYKILKKDQNGTGGF